MLNASLPNISLDISYAIRYIEEKKGLSWNYIRQRRRSILTAHLTNDNGKTLVSRSRIALQPVPERRRCCILEEEEEKRGAKRIGGPRRRVSTAATVEQ